MSRSKMSLLVVGVIAAVGVAVAGANLLTTPSTEQGAAGSSACQSSVTAKTASSCPVSACAGATGSSSSCPVSSCAKTAEKTAACPSMKAAAGDHKACPTTSSGACAQPCGPKAAKTASIESVNEREGARVVLVGHYACGHCDLGLDGGCQPAFQTKDGKNYLLSRNNLSNELKAAARDKDVEIVTRVKKLDGAKYLEVEVIHHAS
jgi:hypothetical protein